MKKLIIFIMIVLILLVAVLYITYGENFLSILDEKKVYRIDNIVTTEIDTLDGFNFFNKGILSYNNQKIVYTDYNNNILWENASTEFLNRIFTTDDYIYIQLSNNTIAVLDKNNQEFLIAEINGNLANVSRENGKTVFILIGNGQTLSIINENNEIVLDSKEFKDSITGVSISDKSESFSLITLTFENDTPINTLYFNLIDNIEVWSAVIENEYLIKTQVVNNQVIAIGTENIYYYNNNGKLMWKNSIYNKILDYEISKENQKITILFQKEKGTELISYNFKGKLVEIQSIDSDVTDLKIVNNRTFVYNQNTIYLLHNNKVDKIFEDSSSFKDFILEGSNIYILFKDKLVKGQIK